MGIFFTRLSFKAFLLFPHIKKRGDKKSFIYFVFAPSSGLPDGIDSNQKYQFGQILVGLAMENVDKFYGPLV
jgi:hypothetical protein